MNVGVAGGVGLVVGVVVAGGLTVGVWLGVWLGALVVGVVDGCAVLVGGVDPEPHAAARASAVAERTATLRRVNAERLEVEVRLVRLITTP